VSFVEKRVDLLRVGVISIMRYSLLSPLVIIGLLERLNLGVICALLGLPVVTLILTETWELIGIHTVLLLLLLME
jgi:hypothetical protein